MHEAKESTIRRIATAAVLLPLFVILVLKAPASVFAVVTALIMLWAGVEWVGLMQVGKRFPAILFYSLFLLATMAVVYLYVPVYWVMYVAAGWWVLATLLVLQYPRSARYWRHSVLLKAFMGVICLVPCWVAVNHIRIAMHAGGVSGPETLLFVFLLIFAADSGAWFAGKKWGRHKLLPAVSPGKTREGLLGGLMASLCLVLVALYYSNTPGVMWPGDILLCLMTVMFSVTGDLFESMLKREAGIKDSGSLLPGHGGLLDRIDSVLAAAPVFVSGALLIDKILR